jgi:hypothetical protein
LFLAAIFIRIELQSKFYRNLFLSMVLIPNQKYLNICNLYFFVGGLFFHLGSSHFPQNLKCHFPSEHSLYEHRQEVFCYRIRILISTPSDFLPKIYFIPFRQSMAASKLSFIGTRQKMSKSRVTREHSLNGDR